MWKFAKNAIDTATSLGADYADKKDSQCVESIVNDLESRLHSLGLMWTNVLADAGYSSGEIYAYLDKKNILSFIPPHANYKGSLLKDYLIRRKTCSSCPIKTECLGQYTEKRIVITAYKQEYDRANT